MAMSLRRDGESAGGEAGRVADADRLWGRERARALEPPPLAAVQMPNQPIVPQQVADGKVTIALFEATVGSLPASAKATGPWRA